MNRMNNIGDVADFGLTNLRMLLIEHFVAQWRHSGEITEDAYKMFRGIADKKWAEQEKLGVKLLAQNRTIK